MKVIADDVEGLELSVGDSETCRICLAVLDGRDVQPFFGGGMRNQFNDGFQRRERFGTPIHGNEGKEAVFDLVPLARRRGIMRHGDREMFFIGQGLQGLFPQLVAHSIAAAPISRDEQFVCLRIQCPVPDIINTATRRGIGSNGQQTEELYTRVQTKGSAGKYAA
jgi:hypothetical protein